MNLRLYRTSWIVAGVGLIIALLTLQAPIVQPEPALPTAFDTGSALDFTAAVEGVSRRRVVGGPADSATADLVRNRLRAVPGARAGGTERVREQEFTARDANGRLIRMRNVFLALPPTESGVRGGILVVAPRDTPRGVAAGASSTGILLQLARLRATTVRRRPVIFVSTDGSAVGNAGIRWFLSRFNDFSISAAIVLDAPGEGRGEHLHIWTRSGGTSSTLDLIPTIERAVERAGAQALFQNGALRQLAVGALPQTFGDQGPLIEAGIATVALSNRPDSPLKDDVGPSRERVTIAGRTAAELLSVLDAADTVRPPEAGYWLNGRVVRPLPLRAVALLLLLPALVLAADAWARLRRTRDGARGGFRALLNRVVALGAALIAAHLASLLGAFPGASAGAPPLPTEVEFGPGAVLGIAIAIAVGVGAYLAMRQRTPAGDPADEMAASLALLAVLLIVLWWLNPFAAILAAPAAHAGALAARPHLPITAAGLGLMLFVGPLLLLSGLAPRLDESLLFSGWYLFETTASGARGVVIPAIVVGVSACLWALGEAIARGWHPGPQRRRRPRRAPRRRARRARA